MYHRITYSENCSDIAKWKHILQVTTCLTSCWNPRVWCWMLSHGATVLFLYQWYVSDIYWFMECIKPLIWEITAFRRSQVTCIVLHRVVGIPKRRWGWAGTPGHLKRLYINEHFPVWKWKTHFLTPEMLRKNVFESPENQTLIQPIEAICPRTGRSYVAAVAWGGLLSSRATKCHGETLSLDGQGLKLWILPVLCTRSKVGSEARLGNLVNPERFPRHKESGRQVLF